MKYRPEIDGLRAVAVLPVILAHAGFETFRGGFVGVDVFFVISGFLITTILLAETSAGHFSLLTFYERRARRILPALFVVMALCLPMAYWSMLPNELKNFGQSLVATSLFANNVLLMMTSGYWSLASEFKPLLHTWSLGVEEQFYIFFPLLLMACRRWRPAALMVLFAVLAIISLAVAEWGSRGAPDAAFYLLPTRAWELLMGSMAALLPLARPQHNLSAGARQGLSLLGLGLIAVSVFGFDVSVRSPSLLIMLPVLGAVLIIVCATTGTWVQRLLASKVPVTVGLISYSAYLWHQPLFAFARVVKAEAPEHSLMLGLSVLTLALAYLSWRHIEAPFRAKGQVSRSAVFASAVLGSLMFVLVGGYLQFSKGMPERFFDAADARQPGMYIAYNERVFQHKFDAFPRADVAGVRKVLVQGNSFARDFVNMNMEAFDTANVEFVYRDDFPQCLSHASGVHANLLRQADVIVYASGGANVVCINENIVAAQAVGKAIYYMGGKQFGYNLNWVVRLPLAERVNQSNAVVDVARNEEAELKALVPPSHFMSIYDRVMVGEWRMPITDAQGHLLTPDRVHLTQYGARYVGPRALYNAPFEAAIGAPARLLISN